MVTGVIVIMLHAKTPPYYNVWHKVISYCFHGNWTRYENFNMWLHVPSWNPTCVQSFRFVLFMVFKLQGSKLKNNNKKQKNWENELFVISPLLVMQFLPYFRYTCMLPIATILRRQNWSDFSNVLGMMLKNLVHPYIQSTTVLCDVISQTPANFINLIIILMCIFWNVHCANWELPLFFP